MKKVLFIFAILVITGSNHLANGQSLKSIPFENSGWTYIGWILDVSNFPVAEDVYKCYFDGDTNINSNSYKKFYYDAIYYWNSSGGSISIGNHVYIGSMRSVSNLYYFCVKDSTSELLVYDLSKVNIGDTLPRGFYCDTCLMIIDDTSHKLMNDGSVKRFFHLDDLWVPRNPRPIGIFESIGLTNGLIPGEVFERQAYNGGIGLHCFCHNGNLVYKDPNINFPIFEVCDYALNTENFFDFNNDFNISPNPFNTFTQITVYQTYHNISLAVYDIQGKLVVQQQYKDCSKIQLNRNQLSNGLYFLKLTLDDKEVETGKIVVGE